MDIYSNITEIKGIGEKTASLFAKASVFCVKDLILYYPRNYINYPEITCISGIARGRINCIKARITGTPSLYSSRGKTILSFDVADETGSAKIYYFNMPYLKNQFRHGMEVCLYGTVPYESKGIMFSNPKVTTVDEYNDLRKSLRPVYPLVKGLTEKKISDTVMKIFRAGFNFRDFVPEDILKKYGLCDINTALKLIHFPGNDNDIVKARKRLAFNEFFVFLYNMKILKGDKEKKKSTSIIKADERTGELKNSLEFKLTNGQEHALKEIMSDMESGYLMNRLLQGDVGCGKTIVAFLSCYNAFLSGYQSAVMAPTVVLATQHYNDFNDLNEKYKLGLNIVLLTGSMKAAQRRNTLALIEEGGADIIIGTHALITDKVNYKNLAFAVVDEQHRFGVKQRYALIEKGKDLHLLVMSATPIPRTLGLILYGDMDISVIKEKPANRLPLKNAVVNGDFRPKNYKFMQEQIDKGHQIYIICPMVLEGEQENLKNVETYADEIKPFFKDDVRILSLHGKMKDDEKEEIMEAFKNHEADILISTTVIEVGVNVPNATVIMIENADRFGLSSLHQLRGRVGRGDAQSYAIFVSENDSKKNMERLGVLAKSNDGFYIAEEDLKQRGPGDFFGYRQSGDPSFKLADIYTDADMLSLAKDMVDMDIIKIQDKLNDSTRCGFEDYLDFGILCL